MRHYNGDEISHNAILRVVVHLYKTDYLDRYFEIRIFEKHVNASFLESEKKISCLTSEKKKKENCSLSESKIFFTGTKTII